MTACVEILPDAWQFRTYARTRPSASDLALITQDSDVYHRPRFPDASVYNTGLMF